VNRNLTSDDIGENQPQNGTTTMKTFNFKAHATAVLSSMLMLGVSLSSHALSPQAAMEQGLMDEPRTEYRIECMDGTIFLTFHPTSTICDGHGGINASGGGGIGGGKGDVGTVIGVDNNPAGLRTNNNPTGVQADKARLRTAPSQDYNSSRSNKPSE